MRALPALALVVLLAPVGLPACGAPSVPVERAGLVFDPPMHDLGQVAGTDAQEVVLPWRRTGDGPLRLVGVRTDCGCALVDEPARFLSAGARGALRLTLHPRRRSGPFHVRVRVYTSAPPPGDRLVVRLRGHVGTCFSFHPPALDLGARSPGAWVQREVEVRWARPEDVRDPAAPAAVGATGGGTAGLEAVLIGLRGQVRVAPPALGGLPGCLLRLEFHVPGTPGPFRGRSVLRLGSRVLGSVPVRGRVARVAAAGAPTSRRR